ncbi:MAG: hypothetical protein IKY15_01990, partial [Clostridia bacterium]|nr:hypothetical protein [Clostridia bacterium]
GEYKQAKQSAFTQKTETLEVKSIKTSESVQKFDYVYNADRLNFVNMFIYLAENELEQKYINYKNTNREFPFVFNDGSTISVVSLSPEILSVDAHGLITLNKPGLATVQVTSILDTSVITRVYINVTKAFDKMQIENMAGEKLATNAYINVYATSPVSIKYSFTAQDILVVGQDGQPLSVKLQIAVDPNVKIDYGYVDYYYTRAEKYGQLIIFTATSETRGTNFYNKVKFSPTYSIEYKIDGVDVRAEIVNFNTFGANFSPLEFSVLARLGTQKIESDMDRVEIEPVDEVSLTITQTTDEQFDTLSYSFVKVSDKVGGPQDYFKVIKTTQEKVFDDESKIWTIKTHYRKKKEF